MVQCQAVNVAPWKIIGWFPRVVENLNGIEESLASVLQGDAPNKDLLPKLGKHWEELSHERAEDYCLLFSRYARPRRLVGCWARKS